MSSLARAYRYGALVIALTVLVARGATAFGTSDVLDWDETYYASTTSTAAHGLGLYPYVLGYPQIPNMGGVGFVIYLYVLAYKLIGPHLISLRPRLVCGGHCRRGRRRAVDEETVRRRRGFRGAGHDAGAARLPTELPDPLRHPGDRVRRVGAGVARTAHRPESLRWSLLVGFVFALALEVHLHTAAAAFAVDSRISSTPRRAAKEP
jgi:hypothetical protein